MRRELVREAFPPVEVVGLPVAVVGSPEDVGVLQLGGLRQRVEDLPDPLVDERDVRLVAALSKYPSNLPKYRKISVEFP